MQWQEIRSHYPHQWLLIEAIKARSEPNRQLTRVNAGLFAEIDLGKVEEVWFKGAADNDLQGPRKF